ncbi:MAG TPA: YqjK-like family protein [Burkholderiales bacterium]|nr:YqjK-like family protein [Burkholderiales bacterium]
MNRRRLDQIHARREQLLARSAAQRDELALLLAPLKGPLALADRGLAVAQYVRAHPGLVAIAVAGFVVFSPKRAFRWARRAFSVWRGYRWAARALAELAPPLARRGMEQPPQSSQS